MLSQTPEISRGKKRNLSPEGGNMRPSKVARIFGILSLPHKHAHTEREIYFLMQQVIRNKPCTFSISSHSDTLSTLPTLLLNKKQNTFSLFVFLHSALIREMPNTVLLLREMQCLHCIIHKFIWSLRCPFAFYTLLLLALSFFEEWYRMRKKIRRRCNRSIS